jgi:hypothetical protein
MELVRWDGRSENYDLFNSPIGSVACCFTSPFVLEVAQLPTSLGPWLEQLFGQEIHDLP